MMCPPHVLANAQLELWAMARNELYPTRSTSAITAAAANISRSSSPSPSPSPVPLTVSATSTSAAAAPSLSPPPPMPFPLPLPLSVNTPLHRSLNYHYGGYGSVEAHYSPAGEILVPTSISFPNSDDGSDVGDCQYPSRSSGLVLDVCTPVLVCIWHATEENTVGFLSKLLHPRADESPSFRIGELILAYYGDELEAMGVSSGVQLERHLDSVDSWSPIPWTQGIPVFGKNKAVFLRTVGLDITPPDHFIDLLPYLHPAH
ncbi:hypothetical protein B0H13DRAFT_2300589 [Mycena leptocephala]|nr:hypothetical protein B0H13DRAFT_2300589 [Mycena leptocephala]